MQHGRRGEHVQASLREMAQDTLGAWAAGLRKVLNSPFRHREMAGGRQP